MGAPDEKKQTCGTICLKYLLFTFNFLFWVSFSNGQHFGKAETCSKTCVHANYELSFYPAGELAAKHAAVGRHDICQTAQAGLYVEPTHRRPLVVGIGKGRRRLFPVWSRDSSVSVTVMVSLVGVKPRFQPQTCSSSNWPTAHLPSGVGADPGFWFCP